MLPRAGPLPLSLASSTAEAVSYLLERGLLGPERVVDGSVRALDASKHNRNVHVLTQHGPSYFVKRGVDTQGAAAVAREALAYGWLGAAAELGLRRILPRFYGYDTDHVLLVLEGFPEARDLREHHARSGRFSAAIASAVGAALAAVHRIPPEAPPDPDRRPALPRAVPWVLSLHRPVLEWLPDIAAANREMLRILQAAPDLCAHLDALYEEWQPATFIHGDLRWDNCLVLPRLPGRRTRELKLLDWEMAGLGDPDWDIGAFLSDYLHCWISSIPLTGEMTAAASIALARHPLREMHPAMRSFWASYVRAAGLDPRTACRRLVRATRFAAARLVQTVYEELETSTRLGASAVHALQVSSSVLRRPAEAPAQLLGISLPELHPI